MKFIFNGILLAAAIAIFFVFTKPQYTDNPDTSITVLQQKYSDVEQTRKDLSGLKTKLASLDNERNTFTQQQLDRLERMLPLDVNPVLLIMELDTLAKDQSPNMSVKNIKFEPAKKITPQTGSPAAKKELYDTFALSFDVTGSYSDFYSFMNQIEQGLRIVDVVSITVTANDKVDLYQYTVKAHTYSMK